MFRRLFFCTLSPQSSAAPLRSLWCSCHCRFLLSVNDQCSIKINERKPKQYREKASSTEKKWWRQKNAAKRFFRNASFAAVYLNFRWLSSNEQLRAQGSIAGCQGGFYDIVEWRCMSWRCPRKIRVSLSRYKILGCQRIDQKPVHNQSISAKFVYFHLTKHKTCQETIEDTSFWRNRKTFRSK